MFEKIRIAIIIICLGLCAGLGAHFLTDKETGILIKQPLSISIPEEGIKTDAFGIRLLQAAMKQEPEASVLVAPALTGEALLLLREHASESIRQDIDKLGIVFPETEHTSVPPSNVIAAADYGLHYTEEYDHSSIVRLPFRVDRPTSMSLFNGMLTDGIKEVAGTIISSKLLTHNIKFIIGTHSNLAAKFETPFLEHNCQPDEFENANGSLSSVNMMRLRTNVRYVRDDNGAWEAIALLLKPDHNHMRKGEPTAWIGILPASSATKMAEKLTVEQLHTIRKKLTEATPIDCCVSLPKLFWAPPARNLQPLMEAMDLGHLFEATAKNWKFTNENIKLDTLLEKIGVSFRPDSGNNEQQPHPENAAASIRFNRPFIWIIGDLTTETPPYFIGLVQNL